MPSLKQSVLQILMEYSLVEVFRLDWAQVQPDSSQAKQIALRNYALLVHRLESEVAASQLRASTSSLSGNAHHTLLWAMCVHLHLLQACTQAFVMPLRAA